MTDAVTILSSTRSVLSTRMNTMHKSLLLKFLPISRYNLFRHLSRMSKQPNEAFDISFLTQDEAINLDKELFDEYGFSVDQLMELAGLSVASAVATQYNLNSHNRPVICCGPGNNGGDGLVCARHLKLFGYSPVVICPKPSKSQLFQNLIKQCVKFNIPVMDHVPDQPLSTLGNLIIDSVFGFSFKPPNRNADFARLLNLMHVHSGNGIIIPMVSIDIPSGWDVNSGSANIEQSHSSVDPNLRIPALQPECLISLTSPKMCAKYHYGTYHFLGGRFVPDSIKHKYMLNLPDYEGTKCFIKL